MKALHSEGFYIPASIYFSILAEIIPPMSSKAERTTKYIIETVAPIFNKYGYVGTSMSHLTEATGLTKGAIYGNFENKEALALSAFEHNRNQLLAKIDELLGVDGDAMHFYRQYDIFTMPMGGCPILNIGVDAQNNNPLLAAAVKETVKEIEGKIALVLENGINNGEMKIPVPPLQFAKQLYTILQGAVAMGTMTRDRKYLMNTITYLEHLVGQEIGH